MSDENADSEDRVSREWRELREEVARLTAENADLRDRYYTARNAAQAAVVAIQKNAAELAEARKDMRRVADFLTIDQQAEGPLVDWVLAAIGDLWRTAFGPTTTEPAKGD